MTMTTAAADCDMDPSTFRRFAHVMAAHGKTYVGFNLRILSVHGPRIRAVDLDDIFEQLADRQVDVKLSADKKTLLINGDAFETCLPARQVAAARATCLPDRQGRT